MDTPLVEKVQRLLVSWAARCDSVNRQIFGMCTNLDTGALAGSVPFLPNESIGTLSVCIVVMGQNKMIPWLPQAWF
jgi:hypothetical protein